MPKIRVEVNHKIEQHIAVERIKELLNKLRNDYGEMITELKENWNGSTSNFSFKAMGMSVEGFLKVNYSDIYLEGKIPLAALPFKKTIENKIREEAIKLLK